MNMKNLHIKLLPLAFLSFSIMAGYAQTCPSSMISYWNLDDVSEVLFRDKIASNHAVAETSVETEESAKVGTAKYFDGADVVNVSNNAVYNFTATSSFSIELWVKVLSTVGTLDNIFIGKNDPSVAGAYWSIGMENSTGQLYFDLRDANNNIQTIMSTASVANGAWHHVVAVRNEATNQNLLYINGAVVASATVDYTGSLTSTADINIGYLVRQGTPNRFFNGYLDEIAIYNKALTSAEINEHVTKNSYGISVCSTLSPTIISSPVETAVVGTEYAYKVVATGMPTIAYSLVKGPSGLTLNPSTGEISWTPASTDIDAAVVIRASNSYPPADTQSYRIFLAEAPVCPEGIQVLYKLNETSGPTYVDFYTDHTINATVSPSATTGIVNGAQQFNGSTKMEIPDLGDEFEWTQSSNFSIELWLKTTQNSTMVAIGRERIAGDEPDKAKWWIGLDASGQATFSLQDNGAVPKLFEISDTKSLANNAWHHIIAVRNGAAQKNILYVDGVKVAEATTDYANSFKADLETPISLGYWKRAFEESSEYHFIGALDEVAIFNKAITDAEAVSFFNAGRPSGHCAIDNFLPVITSTPVKAATEDILYSYTFTVEDYDAEDLISLNATTKPSWLNFNYTSGQRFAVLTGTPTNDNVGNHNVVLTVSDGTVTKEQAFTVAVANVNDAPVITSTPVTTGEVSKVYTYVLTATDVDANTTLTLSAPTLPAWLTFNPATGILTGTPAQTNKGQHPVVLRASDGTANTDQSFTITVTGPTAIEDLELEGISIYPVPASEFLIISFDNLTEDTQLEIISAAGQVIRQILVTANQSRCNLDLNGFDTGTYYLHIKNNKVNSIGKFIVTK